MAFLPLSREWFRDDAGGMEIAMLVFFVLLLAASLAGLTADSRDSADWKPTNDGRRAA
ncbi:hypothetical protein ACWT_6876 [Actinoplanes sp. SE50]|uniref:hypothetical protein n=1 Tax=unclassified Actinoplanes TaxID=2626549 RepID=UPI00023ED510|nr:MULTISPECIES: hypothetical protein [unclassified Actinoplanes]AEV87887.1 hypothetical protein ACPL_7007 [Actinoplanes sp. SE50/110]ATO86291.1 hypothetical protein ACWT_6876 [Actinoplanes sp. SE50]SLM03706.1 hypothetical protein ACSP50_7005 [Actinoplanes sp. SE50/110]